MTEPVRLALFGAGNIGARHLSLAQDEPGCEITAVADPLAATADLANRYGARWYSNANELLDSEALDGAIIATPNDLHASVGIACAEHGLPVLMEKPITDTIEAGETLLQAASRHGTTIAVGHHRRFDPTIEAAHEILREGGIGRLAAVECLWSLRKHDSYYEPAWRRNRPSGGPVLINLIHDIDLLRYLCGDMVRVHAEGGNELRGNQVEDTIAISVRFESGALGTILACDAAPSPWGWETGSGENPEVPATGNNCFRFLGTEGSLALPRMELWRHDQSTPMNWHQPIHMQTIETGPRSALKDQLSHFCGVVRGEHPPRVNGEDGLATLRTALAILASIDSGQPANVKLTCGPNAESGNG